MPRITLNIFDATPFRAFVLATMVSFLAFTPVAAQDYQKGYDAFEAGDYATALKEFRPLAEQGNALLQTVVGDMYRKGKGVTQDYAEATKWYHLAAEQGKAQAQYNLGFIYKNGEGVPQDYAEGIKWYRLAADQGDVEAQNNLAVMYEEGNGVLQNNIMAHMWYNLAAANGHEKAGEWRDERAGLMTNADISKAQALARQCMSSGYTKCGD